ARLARRAVVRAELAARGAAAGREAFRRVAAAGSARAGRALPGVRPRDPRPSALEGVAAKQASRLAGARRARPASLPRGLRKWLDLRRRPAREAPASRDAPAFASPFDARPVWISWIRKRVEPQRHRHLRRRPHRERARRRRTPAS